VKNHSHKETISEMAQSWGDMRVYISSEGMSVKQSRKLLRMGIRTCDQCLSLNPLENRFCKYCKTEIFAVGRGITVTHLRTEGKLNFYK